MNLKIKILRGVSAFCLILNFLSIEAQEMGVNFNESMFLAEDLSKLARTNTSWVRSFFDFFTYYEDQDLLSDIDDPLEDFLNLKNAGYHTILSIKWNFHNKSYPDTTSEEMTAYNEFLQRFLDRVWGKIDIIVVGNEPFIESMNDYQRNTKLPPFYQYMCNRVHEYKLNNNDDIPIYFGAFNKLYGLYRDTEGVLKMLEFVSEKSWIEGIDLHIHHTNNDEIVSMYSYANDKIRADQKILVTEFSLIFWWKENIENFIPAQFASKYDYSYSMLVHEYISYALSNRRPKEEWDDFLSMCSWFEDRKHYLWEVYEILSQYKSFHVATYSFQISWGTSFDGSKLPWMLNNLMAAVTIEDNPETGEKQFNYAFIDDFFKIQELSGSEGDTPLLPDSSKLFMKFAFDDEMTDASPENVEFILSKGTEEYSEGKYGKALSFNNTAYVTKQNDIINVGSESSTLGVWVKMDQSTTVADVGMTILHQKDPVASNPPGRIMMEILNGDMPASFESGIRVQSFNTIDPEVWYHIAVVHDAEKGVKSLYVNGVLHGIASFGTEKSIGSFVMGAFKTEERAYLYGSLDELFWTREVLSASQIRLIMNEGISNGFAGQETAVPCYNDRSVFKLFYPNPANGSIEFSQDLLKQHGQFQLFNMKGVPVTCLQTVHSGKINLDKLKNGTYLIKLITDNRVYSDRLILIN